MDAQRDEGGFSVTLSDLTVVHARKLLLATGVLDEVLKSRVSMNFMGKAPSPVPTATDGSGAVP